MSDRRLPVYALYLGGFIGPLGGNVFHVLVPTLQRELQASLLEITVALSAYLLPFMVVQFFSGALSDRIPRHRVLIAGYVAFSLTTGLAALAPTIGWLTVARALQGSSNAFMTPVLAALLGDLVPSDRLGRAMGLFNAMITSGLFLAPLLGGVMAVWNWRFAYLLIAAVSLLLSLYYLAWAQRYRPPARQPATDQSFVANVRLLLSRQMLWFWITCALAALCLSSLTYLVSVYLTERWQLSSIETGTILSAFSLAGIAAGPIGGMLADRFGRTTMAFAGLLVCSVLLTSLAAAPSPLVFGAIFFGLGLGSSVVWAALFTWVVGAYPANRGAATSVYNASRFVITSSAPFLLTTIYLAIGPTAVFLVAATGSLLAAGLVFGGRGDKGRLVAVLGSVERPRT